MMAPPTDRPSAPRPSVGPSASFLGLTAAKTVRRARASGRVWKPDSASFEAAERKRGRAAAERLSDLSERKASPSRRATEERTWMADGGNGRGKEGSTQMLAYFMEEGEAAVCGGGVLWPRIQVQNAESMPPTHAYGTSRDGNSDSTTYSSSSSIPSTPYNGKHRS